MSQTPRKRPTVVLAIICIMAVISGGVYAAFTSSDTATQSVHTGTVIVHIDDSALTQKVATSVANMAAGDTHEVAFTVRNDSTLDIKTLTLSVTGPLTDQLISDTQGLQARIDTCTVPYTEHRVGSVSTFSCGGTETSGAFTKITDTVPDVSIKGSADLPAHQDVYVRVAEYLPYPAANNLQTQTTTLTFLINALQRDGVDDPASAPVTGPTPTAASGLTVSGTGDHSVSLSWTGGANDTSYTVETRPAATGGSWFETNTVLDPHVTTTVTSLGGSPLVDGTPYEFRVVAYNNGVPAVPADPSNVVVGTPTSPGCTSSYCSTVSADSPGAWWSLGGTGTTSPDLSGGTNPATFVGVSSGDKNVAGPVAGGAVNLTGASDVTADGATSFTTPGHPFSIETWVDPADTSPGVIWSLNGSQLGALWWSRASAEAGRVSVWDPQSSTFVDIPALLAPNFWHQIVVTSTGGGVVHVIVDGVDRASFTTNLLTGSAARLTFGATRNPTAANFFTGAVSQAAVYPSVLSVTRAAAHWSTAAGVAP